MVGHHLARAVKVARLRASAVSAEEAPTDQYGIVPAPLSRSRRNAVPGEAHQKAEAPRATTDHSQFTLLSCQSCWHSDREESLGQAHDHVQCVPK